MFGSTLPDERYPRGMVNVPNPLDLKQEKVEVEANWEMSTPYAAVEDPETQHCKSEGPEQYPGT